MNNTTIKKDSHGLYVRTNGAIYRPQLNKYCYATSHNNWGRSIETQHIEGAAVKVGAVNQTPFCRVVSSCLTEWWNWHGQYKKDVDTNDLFVEE